MKPDRVIVDDPIAFAREAWTTPRQAGGLQAWVEAMSGTGRRQATAEAGRRLDDWRSGEAEWRPSRGEVKAWVTLVEAERHALHNRVEGLTKENEALTAQRDDALVEVDRLRFEVEGLQQTVAHVCRARDEALESYREDVEHFRAHVQTLDADRTRRTRERDDALEALALSRAAVDYFRQERDELREAYDQAEAERNKLARACARLHGEVDGLRQRAKVGRVECSHTPGGGAK